MDILGLTTNLLPKKAIAAILWLTGIDLNPQQAEAFCTNNYQYISHCLSAASVEFVIGFIMAIPEQPHPSFIVILSKTGLL